LSAKGYPPELKIYRPLGLKILFTLFGEFKQTIHTSLSPIARAQRRQVKRVKMQSIVVPTRAAFNPRDFNARGTHPVRLWDSPLPLSRKSGDEVFD
jgi:hypothetical protein